MLFLEIQRGKTGMRFAEFTEIMLKTAACAARMMKYSRKRKTRDDDEQVADEEETVNNVCRFHDFNNHESNKENTYLGDAWFGSVDSILAAVLCV